MDNIQPNLNHSFEIQAGIQQTAMQALPNDIRNLPKYSVSTQLFVCTTILLFLLLFVALLAIFHWLHRVRRNLINPEYMANHIILMQIQGTKRNIPVRVSEQQLNLQPGQSQTSNDQYHSEDSIRNSIQSNRNQSRFLEFICLIVVVAININAYTSLIMECIAFAIAIVFFVVFNVLRKPDREVLRVLFLLPLVVAYLPYYIFKKSITETL